MVLQGPDKGRRFELPDAPTLVGRESRQLPLTDNTVSRRHAELTPGDDGWVLQDLGSSNGTYINGLRVTNRYTLVDIALFAYTHLAHECDFDLRSFPAIRAWLDRVRAEPDHVSMDWQSSESIAAEHKRDAREGATGDKIQEMLAKSAAVEFQGLMLISEAHQALVTRGQTRWPPVQAGRVEMATLKGFKREACDGVCVFHEAAQSADASFA